MTKACLVLSLILLLGCDARSTTAPVDERQAQPNCGVPLDDHALSITEVYVGAQIGAQSWVELYNASMDEVALDGFELVMLDSACVFDPSRAVDLSGPPLSPKEYRVVSFIEGTANEGWTAACDLCVHADVLCLESGQPLKDLNPFTLALRSPDRGPVASFFYAPERALFDIPLGHVSMFNLPRPTAPTPGSQNSVYLPSGQEEDMPPVVINEVMTKGVDWVELYNRSAHAVDISGWVLRDSRDDNFHVFRPETVLSAGGFLSIRQQADTSCSPTGFDFGLGADDAARLFDRAGSLVDTLDWVEGDVTEALSYGRSPDGGDLVGTLSPPTEGDTNGDRVDP